MCGIVGMYSPTCAVGSEDLERATGGLTHRGPDGQRTWLAADHRVGLGHARLSIIDLATGDQPIASEDGRLQIVVNGEFYDFERIQARAERRGHRLRTRSDSEIALHLYEEHGTGCLEQLRGEFAFVLWDGRDGHGSSPRATASGSSRCITPGAATCCTSPRRPRRCSPPASPPGGTARRSSGPSTTTRRRRTARCSRAFTRSRRATT